MPWWSVLLGILKSFLGYKEAKARLDLETVDDRRKEDAEERKRKAKEAAEGRIKEMTDALAASEMATARGDYDEARRHMATVERLQRERDRL